MSGDDNAGRSSADTLGRSSVDSALRRSFSSDVNIDHLATDVTAADEDVGSDSGSSRPNSRQNSVNINMNSDSRRLIERSISRSRQLLARRPSLRYYNWTLDIQYFEIITVIKLTCFSFSSFDILSTLKS